MLDEMLEVEEVKDDLSDDMLDTVDDLEPARRTGWLRDERRSWPNSLYMAWDSRGDEGDANRPKAFAD